MLSIPVALEGITGPCPYCQATMTAPPLVQSQEYADYYYAHQASTAQPAPEINDPAPSQWDSPVAWTTPAPTTAPMVEQNFPVPAAASWGAEFASQPPAPHAGAPLVPFIPAPAEAYEHPRQPSSQRSPLLIVGLTIGVLGLAGGGMAYWKLKHAAPAVAAPYQEASHVSLTTEEAAELMAQTSAQPSAPLSAPVAPLDTAEPSAPPSPPEEPVTPASALPAHVGIPHALPMPPAPVPRIIRDEEPSTTVTPAALATPSAADRTDDPLAPSPELAQPSLLNEPRAALKAFLSAPNWQARAKLTQHGENLLQEMRDYYANHADGPIKAASIDYLTSTTTPNGKSRFHLFNVDCGNDHAFPVSVESMAGGFKVDWRSFVEFKDLQLPKFFEKYTTQPATFHVVLHRTHYFGTDVPNPERKICLTVEPPVPNYPNTVWVDDNSTDLISKLGDRAQFGSTSYPVVSLRWVKEKNGSAYVTLYEIVADNWRTDANLPKSAAR